MRRDWWSEAGAGLAQRNRSAELSCGADVQTKKHTIRVADNSLSIRTFHNPALHKSQGASFSILLYINNLSATQFWRAGLCGGVGRLDGVRGWCSGGGGQGWQAYRCAWVVHSGWRANKETHNPIFIHTTEKGTSGHHGNRCKKTAFQAQTPTRQLNGVNIRVFLHGNQRLRQTV